MRNEATGLVWQTSEHLVGREVALSGKVQVGGVYPPFAEATTWRWRMWMNGKSVAANGSAESSAAAKKHVEWHWAEFMHRAGLTPKIVKDATDG